MANESMSFFMSRFAPVVARKSIPKMIETYLPSFISITTKSSGTKNLSTWTGMSSIIPNKNLTDLSASCKKILVGLKSLISNLSRLI
jgi:hypothetical protein